MKTITLNGVKYHVDIAGPLDGFVENIHSSIPSIILCRDLSKRVGLESAIHESLHACFPNATEEKVTATGRDIARFLWGLGYKYGKE